MLGLMKGRAARRCPEVLIPFAITGLASQEYCTSIHFDLDDSKWSAGLSADGDYQFISPLLSDDPVRLTGVIVTLPRGALQIQQLGSMRMAAVRIPLPGHQVISPAPMQGETLALSSSKILSCCCSRASSTEEHTNEHSILNKIHLRE